MNTLLSILDFVVLLLLVALVPRTVWKEHPQGTGSLVLSIFIALAVIVFGIVSFSAYLGLIDVSSSLTHGIFVLVLLGMAGLLHLSWRAKPSA